MTKFSLKDLKKTSNLAALSDAVAKMNSKTAYNQDADEYWKPTTDKAGNGYAVIRFLPVAPMDIESGTPPWVRIWHHSFKGPNGWYIQNSLTTIGQNDPMSELNNRLWNSGVDEYRKIVQGNAKDNSIRKRLLRIVSNVLVIEDDANPDSVGKVFKWRYGKKIWDKIEAAMHPAFKDEKPINPFDFEEGANFKIKIKKVEGYSNYDSSSFEKPSALFDGNEKALTDIWNKQYSLAKLIAPDQFKSYDELLEQIKRVLGEDDICFTIKNNAGVTAALSSSSKSTNESTRTSKEKVIEESMRNPSPPFNTNDDDDGDDVDADFKRFQKFAE